MRCCGYAAPANEPVAPFRTPRIDEKQNQLANKESQQVKGTRFNQDFCQMRK